MNNNYRWLPVAGVMAAIFGLSSIPNLHLFNDAWISAKMSRFINAHTLYIGKSGFFSYVLSPHPDFILHKLGHITFYAALGVAWYWAIKRMGWAMVLTMLFAATDELHQHYVAGRSSRFGDILLDSLAGVAAIIVVRLVAGRRRAKPGERQE